MWLRFAEALLGRLWHTKLLPDLTSTLVLPTETNVSSEDLGLGRLSGNDDNGNETLLENNHLRNGGYFTIIASSSHPLLLTEHAANGLVETPLK